MSIITYQAVENKIITLRNLQVILDSDVAELYQVATKEINQAVSRNAEKFPNGYLIELTASEKSEVVTNCDHLQRVKFSKTLPKAFTEKGLYMLATILKSPVATQTTLMIIDTFAKVRELGHITREVQVLPEKSLKQKALMARAGDLIADLMLPADDERNIDTETTFEMNFAIFKVKRTVKKSHNKD
ncbi:MAG: ORF6N domain-containing protein [Pseudomonadota bacterium]